MKHYRSRRRHGGEQTELDITALMNLMVILVPFLLINAVFSRLAILQLNLPGASAGPLNQIKELQLEVIIRKDVLEVGDRNVGVLNRLERRNGEFSLNALGNIIKEIKNNFPQKTDATILVEPDTDYDTLIQVMDRLRVIELMQEGELVKVELFPNISLGDAPVFVKKDEAGPAK